MPNIPANSSPRDDVREGPAAVVEQPQRSDGLFGAQLGQHEGGEQHHAGHERRQGEDVAPTRRGGADEAVDEGSPCPSVEVTAPARSKVPRLRGVSGRTARPTRMTASPIGTLTNMTQRQDAHSVSMPPEDQTDRAAADRRRPCRSRSRASARGLRGTSWSSSASDDGAARAPPTPCRARAASRNQPGSGRSRRAGRRGEDRDAGEEGAAPAEQVAGPGTEQQQAAEGQGVGVEHPGQAGVGEAQRALDVRQRDVHDGRVQHDHQLDWSGSRASTTLAGLLRRRRDERERCAIVGRCRGGRGDCVGGHTAICLSGVLMAEAEATSGYNTEASSGYASPILVRRAHSEGNNRVMRRAPQLSAPPAGPAMPRRPMRADAQRNYERLVERRAHRAGRAGQREHRWRRSPSGRTSALARSTGTSHAGSTWSKRSTARTSRHWSRWPTRSSSMRRRGMRSSTWLDGFVRYAQAKRVFLTELHEAFEKNPDLAPESREKIAGRGRHGPGSRPGRQASPATTSSQADLMQLVGGMCMARNATLEQNQRLLTFVLDGIRAQA